MNYLGPRVEWTGSRQAIDRDERHPRCHRGIHAWHSGSHELIFESPGVMMPKTTRLLLFLFGIIALLYPALPAMATTRYVAQTAGTFSGGSACNGQTTISPATFNGTTLSPGDITYLCGTITGTAGSGLITVKQSGTAGNPIQIIMDTGALLQAPYFPGSANQATCSSDCGAIAVLGQNYVIIDGGSNGTIQNTLDGAPTMTCLGGTCSYQQDSVGVYVRGANNIVRNLTINHIYMACGATNCSSTGGGGSAAIRIDGPATDTFVCNNSTAHAYDGISSDTNDSGNASNVVSSLNCQSNNPPAGGTNIFQNTTNDHCHQISPTGNGFINIWGNDISNWADWIWPGTGDGCHTDGIITWSDSSTNLLQQYIHDNYIHGDLGNGSATGYIFCTYGATGTGSACTIFNNVIVGTGNCASGQCAGLYFHAGSIGPYAIYNNTFVNLAQQVYIEDDPSLRFTIYNNIWTGNTSSAPWPYSLNFSGVPSSGGILSADNYNDYDIANLAPYGWNSNSLTTWQAAGWDTNSVTGSPAFNTNAYTLQSTSAAIGKGTNLSGLGMPALNQGAPATFGAASSCGNGCGPRSSSGAWDIGAYSSGSAQSAPAAPRNLTGVVK